MMKDLISGVIGLGATNASVISTSEIVTDAVYRDICATNSCGRYGKCYMCPPDCGDINELMAKLRNYEYALVYQTVDELEDSFDFEGMIAARNRLNVLSQRIRRFTDAYPLSDAFHLGVGGCMVCPVCAKETGEACRHPEIAITSLEACGIDVSKLAASSGMRYNNGPETVTYFGAVLFSVKKGEK